MCRPFSSGSTIAATLVASGEHQAALDPDNPSVTEPLEGEWRILHGARTVDLDLAEAAVRAALGLGPAARHAEPLAAVVGAGRLFDAWLAMFEAGAEPALPARALGPLREFGEFINRIDDIVVFHPLGSAQIRAIETGDFGAISTTALASLFTDAGNVWRDGEPVRADSLRASAGVGLSWVSPVGPLRLSYGRPVKYQPTDRIQRFQFQVGTAF